jgi:hypothetical protein
MIKILITRIFKNKLETKIWGWKEIRYNSENIDLLEEFKELFPQTKIITLIRQNISKQSKSGWFKEDPNAINIIKRNSTTLVNFYKKHKDYVTLITFEQMFVKENLQNLFKFIECNEFFDENKVFEVLNNKIENY